MAAYLLKGMSSGRTSKKANLTQGRSLKLPGVHLDRYLTWQTRNMGAEVSSDMNCEQIIVC